MIPLDREVLGEPDVYGRDRLFVYLRLSSAPDAAQDSGVDALQRTGHPVVRIAVDDPYDLSEEFFRWEFATAVAGSIPGIFEIGNTCVMDVQNHDDGVICGKWY